MLPRAKQRGQKIRQIAFARAASQFKQAPARMVQLNGILWTTNPEVMQPRFDLCRKAKESCSAFTITNQDSQFVEDFLTIKLAEFGTLMPACDNLVEVIIQELRQLR